ncbi:outer membrane protein assembly factor BamA [Candidatus Cyrtobacter comes]|nr:outer membrane protein assembly factor BamA [Candidatus Cyrtobacter comes]
MKYFLFIIWCLFVFKPYVLFAQHEVKKIIVYGNERIASNDIQKYAELSVGNGYSERDLNDALKRLYGSGLFLNASISDENDLISIHVEEGPVITKIAFEGNKKIEASDFSKLIKLSIGNIYNTKSVDEDAYAILNRYRSVGYMFAKIEPQLIKESKDKVILIYKITEGKKTKINSISFIGNSVFSSHALKSIIFSQEFSVLKILSPFIKYDPSRIEIDKEALKLFYFSRGYMDFKIVDVNAELIKGKVFITFKIEEGEKYRYGSIKSSEILERLVDLRKIIRDNKLKIEEGGIYNEDKIDRLVLLLEEGLKNNGYFFTEIKKKTIKEVGYANLEFGILEAQKVYVNRIDITGNTRTKDYVIRRQINFIEGDSYNVAKVEKSRINIIRLGYFSNVEIIHKIVSQNQVDIEFRVKEESTGNITMSAGYTFGANDIGMGGLNGNLNIRESNIFGSGCTLLASLEVAANNKSLSLSFTDPFFLDMDLKSSFSLGYNVNTRQVGDETSSGKTPEYTTKTYGGSYGVEYKLSDNLFHNIEYSLYKRELDKSDLSIELNSARSMDYAQNTAASSIKNSLSYITVDNPLRPRNGSVASISQEIAGLITGVKFIKNSIYFRKYFPIFKERDNISVTARVGHVFALGSSERVLLIDNFTSNSTIGYIRGFTPLGCGARVEKALPQKMNEGVGGKSFYALNLEASIYINSFEILKDFSFRVMGFFDIGAMFDSDLSQEQLSDGYKVLSSREPRVSAGVGVGLELPILGKISVYYTPGFLIKKESFDIESKIGFVIGQDF